MTSTLSPDKVDAIHYLRGEGCKFVLVQEKKPIRKGWPTRWHQAHTVVEHLMSGGQIGFIPISVGMGGMDVDHGDPHSVVSAHDPFLVLPTERGCHLMWDTNEDFPDRNGIEAHGLTYDLRCKGYLREHGGGILALATALYERAPNECNPFPQQLLIPLSELESKAPKLVPSGNEISQPDHATAMSLAQVGNRNVTLFHFLREWVNRRDPGAHLDQWTAKVLAQASTYNAMLSVPLDGSEVRVLAYGVALKQWRYWEGWNGHYRHDPELQRIRGIKSGQARRSKTEGRDEAILDFASAGWSQRQLAKHFELSRNAIVNVLKRGGP